jgi:prevent-host-death family protein
MLQIIIDQDIRPMSEFRAGIASFIKQVRETKRPLVITQHGKGVGVLLDVGEYEAMREKIELLEDIQTATSQLNAGEGVQQHDAKRAVLSSLAK